MRLNMTGAASARRRLVRRSVLAKAESRAYYRRMDDLQRWRDEFPILARTVYMISNSLGAMPRTTARHLAEYAETWATRGVRGWEDRWWEMPLEVGDKIGRIIGAPAGSVSMHENVTTAHLVALSCMRRGLSSSTGRRRLVCCEMDFPSMIYLYRAQQAAGAGG